MVSLTALIYLGVVESGLGVVESGLGHIPILLTFLFSVDFLFVFTVSIIIICFIYIAPFKNPRMLHQKEHSHSQNKSHHINR